MLDLIVFKQNWAAFIMIIHCIHFKLTIPEYLKQLEGIANYQSKHLILSSLCRIYIIMLNINIKNYLVRNSENTMCMQ